MEQSGNKDIGKKKAYEVTTFSVLLPLIENQGNLTNNTNAPSKAFKEKIINQAIQFHLKGNIAEALKYYEHFINQGFNDPRVFSNYGIILKDLGKSQEAEESYRKAIELNPDFAAAHFNLGQILRDLGKLKEAEFHTRKAIDLNPKNLKAYTFLGKILKQIDELS